jgi:hypothetical protein
VTSVAAAVLRSRETGIFLALLVVLIATTA